jgi:hypothetical protein
VSTADLSADLSGLFEQQGPFVSVYLETESAVENAASRLELRWKDVVRDLEDRGVDAPTIEALAAARGPHQLGGTRVMIASHGTVHFARSLPETTDTTVIRVGPLPYLLPLVDWAQTRIPHLVVLTNREGADILAYVEGADPVESVDVDSGRHPSHKTGIGGWSEHKYQNKVEENWRASSVQVAERVDAVARDINPQVIVVAGDVYAVDGLKQHLPKDLAEKVVVISGGRTEDGSDEVAAEGVLQALAGHLRDRVADALADFAKYRDRAAEVAATHPGTDGTEYALNAADGVRDVVAALQKAQVGTLLLGSDLNETNALWFGPAPTMLAVQASDLEQMGVDDPQQGSLVDVLLRAAIGTGAEVLLVPAGTPDSPADGVGALLRYSDNAAGPAVS